MSFCINCGQQLSEGFVFCPNCGAQIFLAETALSQEPHGADIDFCSTKICGACGERMQQDMFYCLNCGAAFESPEEEVESFAVVKMRTDRQTGVWVNKWIAFMLCLFGGYVGAHKFYEGKVALGLLYFFTCGLFTIGWIIDIFVLFGKPNPYQAKR